MRNAVSAAAFALLALAMPVAHAQELTIPKKMCDAGVFAAGGSYYSFEDIFVESTGALDLNDKGPVFAYGYLADVDFGNELNDGIGAIIGTVDICYDDLGVVQTDMNLRVDVVLARDDFSADAWKAMRRKMLKLTENSVNANALVRLTGQFGIYSDTFSLYFHAKDVSVLATFP